MNKTPLVLDLTPDGKTLAVFYPHCRGLIISRMLQVMGEPELVCPGEANPDVVEMLWPHQEMPEELKRAAEEMTTQNLLTHLGYDKPDGGKK